MIINDEALHKRNASFAYLNENGIGYAEFNVKNKWKFVAAPGVLRGLSFGVWGPK